jgi:hypothetical protein
MRLAMVHAPLVLRFLRRQWEAIRSAVASVSQDIQAGTPLHKAPARPARSARTDPTTLRTHLRSTDGLLMDAPPAHMPLVSPG